VLLIGAGAWYATHDDSDTPADAPTRGAQMRHVADGDTLVVSTPSGRERVRLLGIDAPEASSTRLGRSDCGRHAATVSLRRLVHPGARLRLTTDPGSGDVRDRYGRLLAYAARDGRDLGEAQLRAGMAIVYRYQPVLTPCALRGRAGPGP
jgi:endonuclease YncB( thermonuclease family)